MKKTYKQILYLCLMAGLFGSCKQSNSPKEHNKEYVPVAILHPTTIQFPRSYVADIQAIQFVEVKPKVEGFIQKVFVTKANW